MRTSLLIGGLVVAATAALEIKAEHGAPKPRRGPYVGVAVDLNTTYQNIDGFGFSEAFQRAHAFTNLSPAQQSDVLDLLFDTSNGAGFSILRLGLGSSPNSTIDHMNSPQPSEDGPFKWDRDDSGQVWIAKQAQKYGVETFYADAWSAPGYMKTNGRDDQGGWLCGVRGQGSANSTACQGQSFVQAYAQYLAQYVKAYVDEGIPISSVGFLNEPNVIMKLKANSKPYATMQSNGYQAADAIFALSVALGGIGLPKVGISCCEAQGWSLAREILSEVQAAGAETALSLITTHAYKGTPAAPDGALNTTLPVWITENGPQRLDLSETWYRNNSGNEGLVWAVNLHNALTTGNVSAYMYWIGVGPSSRDAPLIWAPNPNANGTSGIWASNENKTLSVSGTGPGFTVGAPYWAFAHYSRFIRPGAKRIGINLDLSSVKPGTVLASAFKNTDHTIVAQVINNGDQDAETTFSVPGLVGHQYCWVDATVTTNDKKMSFYQTAEILEENKGNPKPLPARSLTSYIVRCSPGKK
ncbi:glycoside hydrolase superfamily [Podospora appendiculata]|uniref:Glycoside hydrolase superfamily n=1 Tax=Podospora appendiculata TaxID=314037 RepID=A0AAE0XAU6_9PEZI|nr:glycoside hydrolase superfamily [Podospora appendiculata]